jgi:hypothetical protein
MVITCLSTMTFNGQPLTNWVTTNGQLTLAGSLLQFSEQVEILQGYNTAIQTVLLRRQMETLENNTQNIERRVEKENEKKFKTSLKRYEDARNWSRNTEAKGRCLISESSRTS